MKMFVKARFVLFALMMGLCTLSAFPAQASHYRYANLSYKPTGNPGEIEFQFRFGIRQVNPPAVGTVVGFETFAFGDGSFMTIYLKVVANSVAESWYVGDMVQSPANQVPVRKTYSGAGPYTAGFSSCCRIAEVGGGSLAAQTIVRPFSGNSSPVSSALPILTVPSGPAVTFQLPAQDPDGDTLRYRLASSSESGINPPANMSINASTGQVTWNNSALNKSISYAAQFIVEDLDLAGNVKTRIPVDVLLKINSSAGTAPIAEIHTHMDGQPEHGPITVPFGTPISFHVHGADIDPGATVTLNTDGLPSGATMTPILPTTAPGNVDSHFNWTPVKAQIGTYVLSFSATDNSGFQTLTSITVNVINNATIANNDSYATVANQSLAVAAPGVLGNDVDQDNDALTAILVGNPANGSVTLNANGSFNYTPNAGFSGVDSFRYKANDGTADSNFATVSIAVQPLSLGIDDATVIEGNSGVAGVAFTVTLAPAHNQPVTVAYSTGNNTAFAPGDYASTSGTLTFAPGEKTKTITVPVKGDEVFEADETFFVNLSNAAGATIDDAQGAGTIVNDDSVGSAGGQIAFQSATGNNADIYVINADGSNKTRLTDHPAWDGAPAFDSTGGRIVFHSNRNGNYDLYIMNADGSGETRLTTNTADDQNPSFSPDGSKVIFISARDIYEMNVDGTGLVRLTNSTLTESSPVYSPDGSKIAYHTEDGNNSEIYVMDANGGNAVRFTNNAVIDGSPKFRPDGGRIVFSRDVNGSNLQQIHVMNSDGTSQARLSNSGQQEFRPVYSPEGSKIAFVRSSDIWLMNADSTGQIQLTSGIASDHAPSWAPGYVVNPNTAPVAQDATLTTNEDTPVSLTLAATDGDGDALTYTVLSTPAHGVVGGVAPNLTYTPHANYSGPDSFNYKANDGKVDSSTATISLTVNAVNDAPVLDLNGVSAGIDFAAGFTEDGGPVAIVSTDNANGLAVSDVDDTELQSAHVHLANSLDGASEVLAADTAGTALTASYNAATGVLALSGTDTLANYRQVLRTVTYENTSQNPAAAPRSITFTINDGDANSVIATTTVTVSAVNDAPVANDQAIETNEDAAVVGVLTASDADGDDLTYSKVADAAHGSVTVNADGSFTYTPDANYNGSDSFTFKAKDGALDSNTATVLITVKSVNDAPVASNVTLTTDEDTPANVTPVASDVDGDTPTYSIHTQGAKGTASVVAGELHYVPNANANGADSFTYIANDGNVDSNVATVNISIVAINDAPVAANDAATTDEDTAIDIDVKSNDTDVDGDNLSITTVSATKGTASVNADGTVKFMPAANYNGEATITYTISDGNGGTDEGTVAIAVTPVNDLPVAVNDAAATDEDQAVTINAKANDTDVDGDTLKITAVTQAVHGSVVINGDGTVSYTANANYNGTDSFTYTVSDGQGGADATVTVTINPINDAPTAVDDTATVDEDSSVDINAKVNDTDVDDDALAVTAVSATNGAASVNADGTVKFTPAVNFNGEATVTYTVSDGNGGTDEGTVTVSVTPVNDAPDAANQSVSTDEDTALNGTVSASDVDGDDLTYSKVADAAHGSVTVNADGSFTYTPDANYNGSDSFTFQAKDGALESNTATVSITVKSVNDAPVAEDDAAATTSITPVSGNVLANDTDVEGDTLSATVVDQPAHGELELNADGSFTYLPSVGFAGTDSFTYRAGDGVDTSNIATVTIAVTQPATTRGGKVTGGGTITDADGERVAFSLNVQSNAKDGSVKGTISYGNSGGNISIRSTTITGLVVTGSGARIFGKATINGFGSYDFVVDVFDNGEPGTGDTFYIQLSNDYSSGGEMLLSGNIQVHK